jgi:hypothetical protein
LKKKQFPHDIRYRLHVIPLNRLLPFSSLSSFLLTTSSYHTTLILPEIAERRKELQRSVSAKTNANNHDTPVLTNPRATIGADEV